MAGNGTIQMRRGTAALWTSVNPVLAVGELGVETDTRRVKIGDGSSAWTSLLYMAADSVAGPNKRDFSASASWNYAHGLGRLPNVQVYTAAGEKVIADTTITTTSFTITFAAPLAGYVLYT